MIALLVAAETYWGGEGGADAAHVKEEGAGVQGAESGAESGAEGQPGLSAWYVPALDRFVGLLVLVLVLGCVCAALLAIFYTGGALGALGARLAGGFDEEDVLEDDEELSDPRKRQRGRGALNDAGSARSARRGERAPERKQRARGRTAAGCGGGVSSMPNIASGWADPSYRAGGYDHVATATCPPPGRAASKD
jgi:hypothetical protein